MNESAHETDIRVVRVMIFDEDAREREDGSRYAQYDVTDNSIAGESRRFFIDERDYKFLQGSVILAGVTIRNKAKKDEDPLYRLNPQWFLPEIVEEITFEKQSKDDDALVLDDEDEKPEKEEKKEEKEEVKEEEKSPKKEEKKEEKEDKSEDGDLFEI